MLSGIIDLLFGPLVGLECRRTLRGWWPHVARWVVAPLSGAVVALIGMVWWLGRTFNPNFRPTGLWSGTLVLTEAVAITIALVLTPALLAGSLTGEKTRGTMMLLLASQVTSREIVASRLVGRLTAICVVMLAGLPLVAVLAGANSIAPHRLLVLVVLPASVALGGGGLSLAASAITTRGRDALLGVYLMVIALIVTSGLIAGLLPPVLIPWARSFNPYSGLISIAWAGSSAGLAMRSITVWSLLGVVGFCCSVWRLRPAYLESFEGRRSGRVMRRRRRVPEIKQRPMLWKELYIEQAGALNPLVRWIGLVMVVVLLGGSLLLGGLVVWSRWIDPNEASQTWASGRLADWVVYSSLPVGCLIQWAICLRAAATVASERERATWDALVTSPLEGREIVWGKIAGSLYSLRGLIVAAAVAWTLPLVLGAIEPAFYAGIVIYTLTASALAATIGVWCSLTSQTTGGAMTKALTIWLVSGVVLLAIGAAMAEVMTGVYGAAWMLWAARVGGSLAVWYPMTFLVRWTICVDALYALFTLVGVLYLWRRFDVLANRNPAEHLVPVRVDSRPPVRGALIVEPPGSVPPRRPLRGSEGDRPRHEGSESARDFWDRA